MWNEFLIKNSYSWVDYTSKKYLKLFQSNWNNKVMDSNKKFAMENVLLVQTICAFLALY